jgi:hypothetical protein
MKKSRFTKAHFVSALKNQQAGILFKYTQQCFSLKIQLSIIVYLQRIYLDKRY